MITVKLSGGLGNQLFQYATGRALAYRNNSELYLDISGFSKDKLRSYSLGAFDLRCKVINHCKSNLPEWMESLRTYRVKTNSFNHVDPIWKFDPALKQNKSRYINLSGYYGWVEYFDDVDAIIRDELKLKTPLEHSCPKWVLKTKEVTTISIHVRRTDYALENNMQLFGLMELNYYRKAIDYIEQRTIDPFFLIFSDDLEWVKANFLRAINIQNYSLVEGECFKEPAQELILMSYCSHNIIANSTFSWWGAWLNMNPEKIVIQPRRWYTDATAQSIYERGAFQIPGGIRL
ncbi:MAG: alpha-1,2-fucosyltransferase [Ginsengibacter sp.]